VEKNKFLEVLKYIFIPFFLHPVCGDKRPGFRSSCAFTYYITRFLAGKIPLGTRPITGFRVGGEEKK
jgi:hypothetical protein